MKDKAKGFFLGVSATTAFAVGLALWAAKSVSSALDHALSEALFNLVEDTTKEGEEGMFTAVIAGKEAFWIVGQKLMTAPVTDDEEIEFEFAVEYDAMKTPREDLAKILMIVDSLREDDE